VADGRVAAADLVSVQGDPMDPIVSLENAIKDYSLGSVVVSALRGVSLEIAPGEFFCVVGPSGSGKTTLLNLIGCVDKPTRGTVKVAGQDISALSDGRLTDLRLHTIGFIFQSFNLVPVLSARQNVELPLLMQGVGAAAVRRRRVDGLLERVGLEAHANRRPSELSGGQRQRVAIARALVTEPKLVLADEPTANLDSTTGEAIIDLMRELNRTDGTTFVFSTHDPNVVAHASTALELADGRVASQTRPSVPQMAPVARFLGAEL
jgi:putative ABC transport system ATP-binding protein